MAVEPPVLGCDDGRVIEVDASGEPQTLATDAKRRWIDSGAIHTGAAANRIRADCIGSTLTLTVNDVRLAETVDADFAVQGEYTGEVASRWRTRRRWSAGGPPASSRTAAAARRHSRAASGHESVAVSENFPSISVSTRG